MDQTIKSSGRYEKVLEILAAEIAQSKAGTRLDSISKLSKRFSVSGITVRNALLLLDKEGLVELRHGSGTYVCEHVDRRWVGVFLGLDISLSEMSYFWRRVAQQARLGLRAHGFRTRLYPGHYRPGDAEGDCCCP